MTVCIRVWLCGLVRCVLDLGRVVLRSLLFSMCVSMCIVLACVAVGDRSVVLWCDCEGRWLCLVIV